MLGFLYFFPVCKSSLVLFLFGFPLCCLGGKQEGDSVSRTQGAAGPREGDPHTQLPHSVPRAVTVNHLQTGLLSRLCWGQHPLPLCAPCHPVHRVQRALPSPVLLRRFRKTPKLLAYLGVYFLGTREAPQGSRREQNSPSFLHRDPAMHPPCEEPPW